TLDGVDCIKRVEIRVLYTKVVAGRGHVPQGQHVGQQDHAEIGQLVSDHHVARVGDGRQGEQDAVCRAVADYDLIHAGAQAAAAEPLDSGDPVRVEAGHGPATGHRAQVHRLGERAEDGVNRLEIGRAHV